MAAPQPPDDTDVSWSTLLGGLSQALGRFLCFGLCLANIAMFGKAMLHHAYTPDLSWLLASGQYILNHQSLPVTDIFSWTMPDKPWVMYQWLFEVLLALANGLLGEQGMIRTFTAAVLGLYVVWPLVRAGKQKVPFLFSLLITTSALYMSAVNMGVRPMAVTSLFLAIQYAAVYGFRQNKITGNRLLVVLTILYGLWGNMHTGVILGLGSLGLFALGDWLEHRKWYAFSPIVPQLEGLPASPKQYGLFALTALLASCVNPYGMGIYSYLFDLSSQQYLNNSIVELMSPDFHMMNFWYLAAFIVLVLLLLTRARQVLSAHGLLHLLGFTVMTLFAQRFVVWAGLFYALILPQALLHWWTSVRDSKAQWANSLQRFEIYRPLFQQTLLAAAVIFLLFPGIVPNRLLEARQGGCDILMEGIRAYNQLKRPTDKVLMEPEIGSCTLAVYPDQRVFTDTRFDFYGQTFTKATRDAIALNPGWQDFLKRWEINTVVLSKRWPLSQVLALWPEYALLYEDPQVVIYRRQTR